MKGKIAGSRNSLCEDTFAQINQERREYFLRDPEVWQSYDILKGDIRLEITVLQISSWIEMSPINRHSSSREI